LNDEPANGSVVRECVKYPERFKFGVAYTDKGKIRKRWVSIWGVVAEKEKGFDAAYPRWLSVRFEPWGF